MANEKKRIERKCFKRHKTINSWIDWLWTHEWKSFSSSAVLRRTIHIVYKYIIQKYQLFKRVLFYVLFYVPSTLIHHFTGFKYKFRMLWRIMFAHILWLSHSTILYRLFVANSCRETKRSGEQSNVRFSEGSTIFEVQFILPAAACYYCCCTYYHY